MTSIIFAKTANGGFGYKGKLPWSTHNPSDIARFVKVTKDSGCCVMGKETFKSLPTVLRNRLCIVVVRNSSYENQSITAKDGSQPDVLIVGDFGSPKGCLVIHNKIQKYTNDYCVIGGSKFIENYIAAGLADNIYVSTIKEDCEYDIKVEYTIPECYTLQSKSELPDITLETWSKH